MQKGHHSDIGDGREPPSYSLLDYSAFYPAKALCYILSGSGKLSPSSSLVKSLYLLVKPEVIILHGV